MSDITGIQTNPHETNAVFERLSVNRQEEQSENAKNKTDFLTLMIAQLENQNPLEPQESGAFLSQLAQFNTVAGINDLNVSMSSMADSFRSSQALQATALVGRSVQIPTDYGELNAGESMRGSFELPFTSTKVEVDIFSSNGELLRTLPMGFQSAGDVAFSWDGFDKNSVAMPVGNYRVEARAVNNGETTQLSTYMNANVDSVTVGRGGGVRLNIAGVGPVALDQIKQIN
ncbi:MAG: flagellar hook assembly protein FlgD [Pseudomonadales bacterium]|nr:flagellar hook assembly protein FlgD [Pseudomonadales bacterium]